MTPHEYRLGPPEGTESHHDLAPMSAVTGDGVLEDRFIMGEELADLGEKTRDARTASGARNHTTRA